MLHDSLKRNVYYIITISCMKNNFNNCKKRKGYFINISTFVFYFVTIDLSLVMATKMYVPLYCPFGNSLSVAHTAPEKEAREGHRSR